MRSPVTCSSEVRDLSGDAPRESAGRPIRAVSPERWVMFATNGVGFALVPWTYAAVGAPSDLIAYMHEELTLASFIGISLVLMLLHELLHALGFVAFAGASPRAVSFTVHWAQLTPATYCHQVIPAAGFRVALLLPLLALGLWPLFAGLVLRDAALVFWSAFMIAGAAGDVAVHHATRHLPPDHRMWVSPRPAPEA